MLKKTLHQHRHNIDISDVHSYIQKKYNTQRISVELFAPVMLVKRVTNVRVTRPIFIFAS
jgi:hypothetical protein